MDKWKSQHDQDKLGNIYLLEHVRDNLSEMFHLLYIIGNRNILNIYAFSNISIVTTFFSETI
uniref:Uncharacterized protein n=1 Tax=Octopus bimaculoides TaxID=37653 RepID=A0A0L8GI98_OCTBM